MSESRLHKSYLNARVNVFFYLVTLFISFFSRKIFLEKLGADFVGLTSTMQNLLGFLNLLCALQTDFRRKPGQDKGDCLGTGLSLS